VALFRTVGQGFKFFSSENRGKKLDMKATEHAERERLRHLENVVQETNMTADDLYQARKRLRLAEIKFHKFNLMADEADEEEIDRLEQLVRLLEDEYIAQGGKLKLNERRRIRKSQRTERRASRRSGRRR
jgi:hypothetical protein